MSNCSQLFLWLMGQKMICKLSKIFIGRKFSNNCYDQCLRIDFKNSKSRNRSNNIYLCFSITFSDGKNIRILELLEPIFTERKFQGVPKLVIGQFCRGTSMNKTAFDSADFKLSDDVNRQECIKRN